MEDQIIKYLLKGFNQKQISLKLAERMDWEGNRNEYMAKALGYDGLKIMEEAWKTFDYWPNDIGIDWNTIHKDWSLVPLKQ
jgi:hypothetical protein